MTKLPLWQSPSAPLEAPNDRRTSPARPPRQPRARGRARVRMAAGALCLGLLFGRAAGADDVPTMGTSNATAAPPSVGVNPTPPPAAPEKPAQRITTSNPRYDATAPAGTPPGGSPPSSSAPSPSPATPGPGAGSALLGTSTPRAPRRRYSGRRIDLDFKGADIHNILRLLADVGQVNIVTSDDVKGDVTIKMRNVPWDQALDVILRSKLLGQVREGNLIRVAPLVVLEKELEQEIARQKQLADVAPTETRIIAVSYAEAKNLQERVHDLLSPRGKISVDERTNQLIVSDLASNLNLVEELVRNLDSQTLQVVIEARIVEANSNFTREIGVQWGGSGFADGAHGTSTGLSFPGNVAVGGGGITDAVTPTAGVLGAGAASPNFAVNLPAKVATDSGGAVGLSLGSLGGAFNLNLRLSAMESTGEIRILSSPRISTMDNVEAAIEQGVSIPISIISAQGIQTVFVDAKLNLTVKPHVTNDGTVIMTVHVTRNEPDFAHTGARGDPTILKKEARTVMLVRDGDTAVIGGIYQRTSTLHYDKVPFLADIPIIGFFFRHKLDEDDRTEFLVFITPRIANRNELLRADASSTTSPLAPPAR